MTFEMYSKLASPNAYTWLGLRENYYLVAAALLVLMILVYAVAENPGRKPNERQLG